jgi:hypothetical protein
MTGTRAVAAVARFERGASAGSSTATRDIKAPTLLADPARQRSASERSMSLPLRAARERRREAGATPPLPPL